jgi:gamma-glutamyltranspeptidase/glutathione hydrolase
MFTTRPEIAGTFGMVASTHWIASAVGMAVLERGGNAFDAACAAGFTLHVAEPHLNGPLGDAPIIIHDARAGTQHVICGQGTSPSAATLEKFAAIGVDLIPATGLLPATVPGAFDAWALMLRDWGTWEIADVLAFVIGYAEQGVPIVPRITGAIENIRPMFETEWQSSLPEFMPNGAPPEPGRLMRRPGLASLYSRVVRESAGAPTREKRIDAARNAWYRGFVAAAIDDFIRNNEVFDTTGRRQRGLLTADDMARWSATVEAPVTLDYHGHTVLKCGAWSQGPAFLQQLALLRGFDLGSLDPVGPDFVHLVAEAAKLAFADREAFYGDPNFVDVPLRTLLSEEYNAARRTLIGNRASLELRPGAVNGHTPWVDYDAPTRATMLDGGMSIGSGEPTLARLGAVGGDTCHVDVIDRWGNMVSATPSGGWLQSSPVIPGLGCPLGTRGQMFWIRPGVPNGLAPNKRPRTTLSPSMALRDGLPWMSFGTPGGEQQDQWSLTFFLRMVHFGLNIQQSIDLPNFHIEHWPSSFWPRVARPGKMVLEGQFGPDVLAALRERGHLAELGPDWSEGRLSGARIEPDGQRFAGANPRGMQGYAVGR